MISINKVANVNDFTDQEFLDSLRKYGAGCVNQYPLIMPEQKNRKAWEVGMVLHAFDRLGIITPTAEILGIGVAKEETISLLSPHVKRLFATDIYCSPNTWSDWHGTDLMIDASRFLNQPYNRRRVVWQHVDGRSLPYEDNSFDAIFSCSSFEHFGSEADIRQAIGEACRVLKPGGVAVISTEYKVSGLRDWFCNVQLFDAVRLQRVWLDGIGWRLADELDLTLDDTAYIDYERSIHDDAYKLIAHPHIKLDNGEFKWTSVNLTFVKHLKALTVIEAA